MGDDKLAVDNENRFDAKEQADKKEAKADEGSTLLNLTLS